jgi:tetratricopeptide (TPR) repeat protein
VELAGQDGQQRHLFCLSRYAAGLAGLAAPGLGSGATTLALLFPMERADLFLADRHDRPPHLPLLAVRTARQALAVNPDDANAWLRLGQAYLILFRGTGERRRAATPEQHWQLLEVLRHVQAATALENALKLNPDLEAAHRALAELYAERAYLDLALEHGRETLRLARRTLQDGKATEELQARLKDEERKVQALDELVRDRRNEFAIHSRPLTANPLLRARLAVRLGLARVALDDILWQSSVQLFRGEGARMELELMLMVGRALEVRTMLDDEEVQQSRDVLGEAELPAPLLPGYPPSYFLPSYEWLRFYQAAATGDYGNAYGKPDSPLVKLLRQLEAMEKGDLQQRQQTRRDLPVTLAAEVGMGASPSALLSRYLVVNTRQRMIYYLGQEAQLAHFPRLLRADLHTLGGLLALEQGRVAVAGEFFRAALAVGGTDHFAGRPLAAAFLERIRRQK